jgi:hypothetical protein
MQAINQKATKIFDELTKDLKKIGDHKKIENSPFMPLCIEVIGKRKLYDTVCLEISFAHYYEQMGDLMRDPEMIFLKACPEGFPTQYYPTYYRIDSMGLEQFSVIYDEKDFKVASTKPRMQKDQAVFAGVWAQNMKDQGFLKAIPTPTKQVMKLETLLGPEQVKLIKSMEA